VDAPGKYEDVDGEHGRDGSRSARRGVKPLGRRSRILDADRVTVPAHHTVENDVVVIEPAC
jgi:hypothetical protein